MITIKRKRLDPFSIFSMLALALLITASSKSHGETSPFTKTKRPNILLIVADDLGYSDLGSFGGEIATPVVDTLAREGMRLSNFHVLPTCSPTRAALISGNDNHVAGMGVMSEFIYPEIANLPGYEGHLSDKVATIPEILRESGYHTYMAGKWHLGHDDAQSPFARGFQQTFAMMNGGGSHWEDMTPLSPTQKMTYRKNGKRISRLPKDFYSTKDYTDAMITFIDSNKGDGKPFFSYLSYTAPHDPLHAPAKYIAKYSGKYDSGWDALAKQRLASLKKLGLIPESVNAFPSNFMTSQWAGLSNQDKKAYARDMEVYAAMVDYMDMSIGRLLDYLRDNGLYDNTLILFISDNGANGAHATAYPGNRDGKFLATFDNSLENRGLQNSFVDMGPSWAQASSTPFRLYKSFTTQGGIKAPLVVKLPGDMKTAGQWSHAFLHVTDIMPTFLEYANVTYPETVDGRRVRPPFGKSMAPLLKGELDSIHVDTGIGYELFEMKAYIRNGWKLLRLPEPFGTGNWQLYNLEKDAGETHDVAKIHPGITAEMIKAWKQYAQDNDVFDHKGRFDVLYRKAYGTQ